MNLIEVRKYVGGLQSNLFKRANNISLGNLKSHFRGSGLQFREHRIYSPGDEVRFIDWKLLAKKGTPYLKTFEEERNVKISVIVDCGPSMFMGQKNKMKIEAALELLFFLVLLAHKSKDLIQPTLLLESDITLGNCSGEVGVALILKTLYKQGFIDDTGKIRYNYWHNKVQRNFTESSILNKIRKNSKSREIVLLSDFEETLTIDSVEHLRNLRRFYAFQINSNSAQKQNMSLLGRLDLGTYHFGVTSTSKGENKKIAKWIKNIDIDGHYVQDFIKYFS
jgi:uncharacterized protein (DUF58 family)